MTKGVDQWMYQGRPQGVSGLNAVVSWPAEEWGRDPAGFAEMRPGVYDVHQRVRDMSRNGLLASMCFPTFTGFSARHLKLRHEIGIDIIAWECDYPHSDCSWPDAPEQVLAELNAAGADDSDINKITWQNSCRFFDWDPFANAPREQATVGALRASAADVDVSIRPRKEWARLYAAKQLAKA